jgi:anti-anti-sigma factor
MLDFETNKIGDVVILKVNEKRLDSSIAGLLKGEFTILLQTENVQKLVLDLSEVESIDSSGLSAMLLAYRVLSANRGAIRIASPSRGVLTLIQISQLNRILPVSETVEEAIKELNN